ncbi:uncharacterized protein LOC119613006 [Lucilia sericata]|uniref:uncharacterized protein LOC119613006 n=1 Tax=Lucilia sericata TaxID=13632 RepID=UPI0018A8077D|nr:uncharacterized protein LOC119613006 [Lucilia sericata]XP_037824858.1 uncharacterized protein LOC119613006 [Lucilia sericata]
MRSNRRLTATRPREDPSQEEYRSDASNRPSERSSQSRSNHRRSVSRRPSESRSRQDHRNRTSHHQNRLDPDLYQCMLCMRFHAIRFCPKFLRMTVIRRIEVVTRHRYCVNCLAKSHVVRSCISMASCRRCHRFHHTMLHPPNIRVTIGSQTTQRRHPRPKPQRQTQPSTIQRPQLNQVQTITPHTPTTKPIIEHLPPNQPTTSACVNQQVIIEAIKSLANVLCSTNKGPNCCLRARPPACPIMDTILLLLLFSLVLNKLYIELDFLNCYYFTVICILR